MKTKELIIYFNDAKINIYTIYDVEILDIFQSHSKISQCEVFIDGVLESIRNIRNGAITICYFYQDVAFYVTINHVKNYKINNIVPIDCENAINIKLAPYYQIRSINRISNQIPKDWSEVLKLNGDIETEETILHIIFDELENPFHTVHAVGHTKLKTWLESLSGKIVEIKVPYNKREGAYRNNIIMEVE